MVHTCNNNNNNNNNNNKLIKILMQVVAITHGWFSAKT